MKRCAIALALVATGCASGRPDAVMPDIAPAPSELVFTGQEGCEELLGMYSRAGSRAALFHGMAASDYRSRNFRAVFTLGLSNLELDSQIRAVATSRGDMLAIKAERARRGCEPPPPDRPPEKTGPDPLGSGPVDDG